MREGRDRVSQSESGERQIERAIREKEETEGKDRERKKDRKKERKKDRESEGGTFCELILSEIFLRTNEVYVYK